MATPDDHRCPTSLPLISLALTFFSLTFVLSCHHAISLVRSPALEWRRRLAARRRRSRAAARPELPTPHSARPFMAQSGTPFVLWRREGRRSFPSSRSIYPDPLIVPTTSASVSPSSSFPPPRSAPASWPPPAHVSRSASSFSSPTPPPAPWHSAPLPPFAPSGPGDMMHSEEVSRQGASRWGMRSEPSMRRRAKV